MRLAIVAVLFIMLVAACGGDESGGGAGGNSPEGAARTGFEAWARTLSMAYQNVSYDTVSESGGFATVRVSAEFQQSASSPWQEQEANVEVLRQGDIWQTPTNFAFGPTTATIQTAETSRNATASVQAVVDAATQQAELVAANATATVVAEQQAATEVARNATATVQTAANHASATASTESAHASATASKAASLDQIYGRMDAAAQKGEWDAATSFADEILADVGDYRDVGEKRESYLDQAYQLAEAAFSASDWPAALKWLRFVQKSGKAYSDAAEMLGIAEQEVRIPAPGVYQVDRPFPDEMYVDFRHKLSHIEVLENGTMKIVATFVNTDTKHSSIKCGNVGQMIVVPSDGLPIVPIDVAVCEDGGSGYQGLSVAPGGTFEDWIVVPLVSDATMPFSVLFQPAIGGGEGAVEDIVLVVVED